MNVYVLNGAVDNPLFEGLGLKHNARDRGLLDTWPSNWRANYQTWEPISLKATWPIPEVEGNVRRFNDFPCVNLSRPAFSQRCVDLLGDILESNGELLPLRHKIGTYYFYNCTRMTNCVDLSKSSVTKLSEGIVSSTENLVFIDELLSGLSIFKVRTQLLEVFCTQDFVDRVQESALQGFVFTPIWPLSEGVTYYQEMFRTNQLAKKWRPTDVPGFDIKGNTVVVRLYCERNKPSKNEINAAKNVVACLENMLYNENQANADSYFGNVEGQDIVGNEIRVFLSSPNCDRLVAHLKPTLQSLPWPGKFNVVKRRGEFVDEMAAEEYVRLD